MHNDRIKLIYEGNDPSGSYVLYWMQQSQRVLYNHALYYAIEKSNQEHLPLVVVFNILPNYKDANLRHYMFMLEGLKEVSDTLNHLNITFILTYGDPTFSLERVFRDASLIIMDKAYLKPGRKMRNDVYLMMRDKFIDKTIYQIESDVIVPVRSVYLKPAYGAYTIRPTLMKHIDTYLDIDDIPIYQMNQSYPIKGDLEITQYQEWVKTLPIDMSVKPYPKFKGGYLEAKKHLNDFLNDKFIHYMDRSDPSLVVQSYMSLYLHFGQISPMDIYKFVTSNQQIVDLKEELDAFIEQLIVRRELAFNFVSYHTDYDKFSGMTEDWAYLTMEQHKNDIRPVLYNIQNIELSKTHDPYFNAAMTEMRITGFMANYMRMYWAKKIMEWSIDMKTAYERIVFLNNKYFIDGRDPNSYSNIAWCFGKHDRPWQERPIFGKLRYMNDQGLKRKFNMEAYLEFVENIDQSK